MGTKREPVDKNLLQLPSLEVEKIIQKTYEQFFSPTAGRMASKAPSPKLSNLIRRLSNFATIVEGNAAMKSGDIGRVMNVWKRWAVLAQGIKKLTQYSIQLPRMIVLLNEVLPCGLGTLIQHMLFIAPSGQQKHFVAKDQYLELQNYWLKYFFNHSGTGTDINRLKNVFSLNVPLVCKNQLDFHFHQGRMIH